MNHMRQDKPKVYELYEELEDLEKALEKVIHSNQDLELNHKLEHMKNELLETKKLHIAHVVREVVGTYLPDTRNKPIKLSLEEYLQIKQINLEQAQALIETVKEKAVSMGLSVVIAVYNCSALPVSVQAMDDSYIASFDVAINKAYTCAALKMSTMELKKLSQPGGELYGIQNTNQGKIVIFGGGEPLLLEGKLIGAIGVSGGSEAQDTLLAEYGKNKLEEVIKWW